MFLLRNNNAWNKHKYITKSVQDYPICRQTPQKVINEVGGQFII